MRHSSNILGVLLAVFSLRLIAAPAPPREEVNIEFEETQPPPDNSSFEPIEKVFRNPVISAGLATGVDAINKSIDSLFESLFYSLLDNEVKFSLTPASWFSLGLSRDVYHAQENAYVVVDKFQLGPRYGRELWRIHDLPINLGVDASASVYDIYLRTDPMRLAEKETLPWWRHTVNNWFGLLPILEQILPPSFNPNELYDPLHRLETPFELPLAAESIRAMPIGNIRSYSVTGGVNLGFDVAAIQDQGLKKSLNRLQEMSLSLPYTIFRSGEYRINVLKKSSDMVWVGLTDLTRFGHSIEVLVGRKMYLLQKTLPLWKGIPAAFFPVDVRLEESLSHIVSQVYEYDLKNPMAMDAYLQAVRGNFAPSHDLYLKQKAKEQITGVSFHYKKKEKKFEDVVENTGNVFFLRSGRSDHQSDSEMDITDSEGGYFVLETKQVVEDQFFDALMGNESLQFEESARLHVQKVTREDAQGEKFQEYIFASDSDPLDVTLSVHIKDRYTETEELRDYLSTLRRATQMSLDDIPVFPIREEDNLSAYRRRAFFSKDTGAPSLIHVPPTYIGSFEGNSVVYFSNAMMERIARRSDNAKWRAFAKAFGIAEGEWASADLREGLSIDGDWLKSAALFPTRLGNYRRPSWDAVREINRSTEALLRLRREDTPRGKQQALAQLFSSDHPLELMEALLRLAPLQEVPRSVSFYTKGKGHTGAARRVLENLNGKTFASETALPKTSRFDRTKEKEAAFNPSNLRFIGVRPAIVKVTLLNQRVGPRAQTPESPAARGQDQFALVLRMTVKGLYGSRPAKIYLKFEQGGKLQLGRLKLIENVVNASLAKDMQPKALDEKTYEVVLSGPSGSMRNYIFDQALSLGGQFKVSVAVAAADNLHFSLEKNLEFRYEDFTLLPAAKDKL